jgi:hypothetical protein
MIGLRRWDTARITLTLYKPAKKTGIVLIMETTKNRKYWIRLNATIEHFNLPIDTWSIGETAAY